jgi:ABC-2 type transport system ATP-binding protein
VQGAAADVSARSGLSVFEARGGNLDAAARRLRHVSGVEAAAVFGQALRVAGANRTALERALRSDDGGLSWEEVEPRLEDVFIHMLSVKGQQS